MDDFEIKYTLEKDLQHLLHALQDRYTVALDRKGNNYCGMQLDWDYTNHHVDVCMPKYIPSLLEQLNFQQTNIKFAPHKHNIPIYGQKVQYARGIFPHLSLKKKQNIFNKSMGPSFSMGKQLTQLF